MCRWGGGLNDKDPSLQVHGLDSGQRRSATGDRATSWPSTREPLQARRRRQKSQPSQLKAVAPKISLAIISSMRPLRAICPNELGDRGFWGVPDLAGFAGMARPRSAIRIQG